MEDFKNESLEIELKPRIGDNVPLEECYLRITEIHETSSTLEFPRSRGASGFFVCRSAGPISAAGLKQIP